MIYLLKIIFLFECVVAGPSAPSAAASLIPPVSSATPFAE